MLPRWQNIDNATELCYTKSKKGATIMKNRMTLILLAVAICTLVVAAVFGIWSVTDITNTLKELAEKPHINGSEYLKIGSKPGITLLLLSLFGLLVSVINIGESDQEIIKNLSFILLLAFAVLILASVFLFFSFYLGVFYTT